MRERQRRIILLNMVFLVVFTILILLSDRTFGCLDMFVGFLYGASLWELVYTAREMHRAKKKLK